MSDNLEKSWMQDKKQTGSYYTPEVLSTFLVNHIFHKYLPEFGRLKILEPSCGDGEFVESLSSHIVNRNVVLDLIEINEKELSKTINKMVDYLPAKNIHGFNEDFLNYEFQKSYSLIIGNPPYIGKKHLTDDQIQKCKKICQPNISGEVKNIWPAFLIKAIENLDDDGVMCFVLPSELLQVKYTSGLRKLILKSFERVEIFAFNELIFDNAEQDVVAIIGIKNHPIEGERGVSFYQVDKLEDLTIPNYTEMNFNVHREKLDKWTNYILSDDQLNNIDEITSELSLLPINDYCQKAAVGIVTAANSYFIRKRSEIESYKLNVYIKPILQKSNLVKNTISITEELIDRLRNNDYPVNLISFRDETRDRHSANARIYIDEGEAQDLHKRYKMTKRVNWYHVPSIWSSEAIFCKRSHLFPRMFLNQANVLVTDSFYRVNCKEGFDIQKLVFSFYNSVTMVLAELEGRFYGGGVLELIPTEFKDLLIPYSENINQAQFNNLELLFNDGADLNEILDYTDPILMPDIEKERILELRNIRQILFNRRTKVHDISINEIPEALEVV